MRRVILFLALVAQTGWAVDSIPHCYFRGRELGLDNERVIQLKHSTRNQFKTQGHVMGKITEVYPDRSGHKHFAIELGKTQDSASEEGIEVVYNEVFGALPSLKPGMQVEDCGEYITSNAPTAVYPASPKGAIIHWVHINPNQGGDAHPSGYLMIDGKLCGQDATHADHGHGRRH